MYVVASGLKIYACLEPTDMRRSFDGLMGMVQQLLAQDPLSGHLFLFRNRGRDRLKILYWDRDGLAIWYKRLESGTFQFPSDLQPTDQPQSGMEISLQQLTLLLGGIELRSVRQRTRYLPKK
jgi:transposase